MPSDTTAKSRARNQAQRHGKPADARAAMRRIYLPNSDSRLGVVTQDLTPATVATALRGAAGGSLGLLQELYIRVEATDSRMRGYVTSLESALVRHPLRVFAAKTGTAESKAAAQLVSDMLKSMRRSNIVKSMARAYRTGVAHFEPIYRVSLGSDRKPYVLPVSLDKIPPTLYMMDMERDSKTFGQHKIKTIDEPRGVLLDQMFPAGKVISITDGTDPGWFDTAGAMRPCLFWHLAKTKNAQWWAEQNEIYGQPHRVAYYEENTDQAVLDDLARHLRQLGRAAYAMLPSGVELDFMEMNTSGAIRTYHDLIQLANDEMAIAILGQTQTSDGGKYGSYAKAQVHNAVRWEIINSIATMVEEAFDELILYVVQINISPDFDPNDLPKVRLVIPNPEEKEVKVRVFKQAMEIGIQIPKQFAHDELGIPEPDEDDEILSPNLDMLGKGQQDNGAGQGRDFDQEDESRTSGRKDNE